MSFLVFWVTLRKTPISVYPAVQWVLQGKLSEGVVESDTFTNMYPITPSPPPFF